MLISSVDRSVPKGVHMLAIIDAPIILGLLILVPFFVILPVWFAWVALTRAGLAGPLALLLLVPFGILIVFGVLAFAEWPNLPRRRPDLAQTL
jgi:hypothetical protein